MRSAAPRRSARPRPGTRRRRGGPAAAGLAGVLVAVLGGAVLAGPADAATSKHLRLEVVTASDAFLVVRQKVATPAGLTFTRGSALFSVDRSGKRRAIGDFDPQLFPDLEGSTLTQSARPNSRYDPDRQHDPAAPEHVRWRDLRTGAAGVREIPVGDDWVGSAPGGWIATRSSGGSSAGGVAEHVIRFRTDGSTADLGSPFAAGVPWSVRPGPAGVLAVSAEPLEEYSEGGTAGSIRYQPYDAPGRWRTVWAPGPGSAISCGAPSRSHVVCEVHGASRTHAGQVLIALRDGTRRWQDAHPSACPTTVLRAVGSSAFGRVGAGKRCVAGRIEQLSAGGVLTTSTRTHGTRGGSLAGLGGFLVVSADQRTVLRITAARSAAEVVTRAR